MRPNRMALGGVYGDDKRLIRESAEDRWCTRVSERDWNYCKYCYEDAPTFLLTEGVTGAASPIAVTRCCWQCGSGLEPLTIEETQT